MIKNQPTIGFNTRARMVSTKPLTQPEGEGKEKDERE